MGPKYIVSAHTTSTGVRPFPRWHHPFLLSPPAGPCHHPNQATVLRRRRWPWAAERRAGDETCKQEQERAALAVRGKAKVSEVWYITTVIRVNLHAGMSPTGQRIILQCPTPLNSTRLPSQQPRVGSDPTSWRKPHLLPPARRRTHLSTGLAPLPLLPDRSAWSLQRAHLLML